MAAEALANHARCNNSFIYDLFQALYRSSLRCPICHHHSNTFDPFLSVSLPIPHKATQAVLVTVIYADTAERSCSRESMGFLVDQDETLRELRRVVANSTRAAEESVRSLCCPILLLVANNVNTCVHKERLIGLMVDL